MVLTPLRALLFVVAAVVAAAGTAFYAGAFDSYLGETAKQVASLSDGTATRKDAEKATSKEDRIPEKETGEGGQAAEETPGDGEESAAGAKASTDKNDVVIPTFAVVRVEPDGSLVIAGSAAPDSHVEVVAGATIIGEATTGPAGDFAVVLDDPLDAGDYQIVLRATSPDGVVATSKETAVVSVPDSPDGQVLALVETPGEPSRLITVPEGEEANEDVASAEPGPAGKAQSGSAGDDGQRAAPKGGADVSGDGRDRKTAMADTRDGDADQSAESDKSDESGDAEDSVDASPPAADTTARTKMGETETAMASGEDQPASAGETSAQTSDGSTGENASSTGHRAVASEKTGDSGAGDGSASQRDEKGDRDASDTEMSAVAENGMQVAGTEAGSQTPAAAPEKEAFALGEGQAAGSATTQQNADRDKAGSQPTVFIEAVEIDRDRVFVAGISEPGKRVRVYANEILLGDAMVAPNGRFLVEATRDLPVGDYIVRADLLAENGADVVARAAVPFERQPGEKLAAVAPRDNSATVAGESGAGGEASENTSREAAPASTDDAGSASSAGQTVAANEADAATGENRDVEEKAAGEVAASTGSNAGVSSAAPSSGGEPEDSRTAMAGEDTIPSDTAAGGQAMSPQGTADARQNTDGGTASPDASDGKDTAATRTASSGATTGQNAAPTKSAPGQATNDASGNDGSSGGAGMKGDDEADSVAMADAPDQVADTRSETAGKNAADETSERGAEMPSGDAQAKENRIASAGDGNDGATTGMGSGSASGPPVVTAPKLRPVDNAVIIRRGDTLWQISRRVYGRGIRYTNIYLANQGQIRNPHWIWPGQVFAVPDKTQTGVPADMTAIGDQAVPLPDRIESKAE